jgi:hypothetical protein
MNARLTALKSHFVNWREWELNPIVIKELRQGVRSWTVTGMLLLFLVVMFITSLGFLVTESFDLNPNLGLGGTMFSAFVVILAGASIFFIPLYAGVRVAAERQENNPDLLYVSTLSPARIIFGKFLCSAYIALLFFSACMPFMAFTNLLRGVDLPTVFFDLAFLFLVVCAANMVAIFLACLPVSRPFKFLFVIYGIFQSIGIITTLVSLSFEFMRSGVGTMMADRHFWIITLTVAGFILAAAGLLFVLSTALISPPSANRALPSRVYLTVIWLAGGLLSLYWVVQAREASRIMAWTVPTLVMLGLALLVVISNSDQLSSRVRRNIPASGLKRFFAFFFFNGAAGGLLWLGAILGVTLLATSSVMSCFSSRSPMTDEDWRRLIAIVTYAFAYALTALFIQRKFMPHRPPKLTGLLAVLLAGGWAIAPGIFLFFVNRLSWTSIEGLQLGNAFNVFADRDNGQLLDHVYFACGWLLLAIALNARWFWQQVKKFHPPDQGGQPPSGDGVPPVPAK